MKNYFKRKPSCKFKLYEKGILLNCDCERNNGLSLLRDNSVDLVLADLPYNIKKSKLDKTGLNLNYLFRHYERILKFNGNIVLIASQPFSFLLQKTRPELFKYEIIWNKSNTTGFVHAKNSPLRSHEKILVFSKGVIIHEGQSNKRMTYNPQGLTKVNKTISRNKFKKEYIKVSGKGNLYNQEFTNYPKDSVYYPKDKSSQHPNQKPLELFSYLIKTFSNKKEVVLDNTSGFSTTAIACKDNNRYFICMEKDIEWYKKSKKRIKQVVYKNKLMEN